MVLSCSAFGCQNRAGKDSGISFHKFPSDPVSKSKWIQACRRKNFTPGSGARLCSQHFSACDFKSDSIRRELKTEAIPSIFPAFPKHLQPVPKQPRRCLQRQVQEDGSTKNSPEMATVNNDTPKVQHVFPQSTSAIAHDHNYSHSFDIEVLKQKNDYLRDELAKKVKSLNKYRARANRRTKQVQSLKSTLSQLKNEGLVSEEGHAHLNDRFSGIHLNVVKDIMRHKGDRSSYDQDTKDFAVTMHYYSPKAYKYLSTIFTLPSPSTIRRLLGSVNCYPGFQIPALQELEGHRGDQTYADASLTVDGMSIKELTQFDQKLNRCFGYVDLGGASDIGETGVPANEVLVAMVVGLRRHWKLPIGYFMIKGLKSGVLAGIIREAVSRCYEAGVSVRSVCMDGTIHNISAFNALGCNMHPKDVTNLNTSFEHPHEDANYSVYAICDPGHMVKNVRNLLAEYKELHWPGVGTVKWSHLEILHNLQDDHGLRLGNRLTSAHINFKKNKMKVQLAIQAIASDSVARALRWANGNGITELSEADVLATARFLELHDQLFDVLNSRSKYGPAFKAAVREDTFPKIDQLFNEFTDMYKALITMDGKPVIQSRRKTGPLGFLACIESVRNLYHDMRSKCLPLEYLCCYKLQQDHLEQFFAAVRMRNGWSYNPTPMQFRFAFRQLLLHAGKSILSSMTGNCLQQDETVMMSISRSSLISFSSQSNEQVPICEEPEQPTLHLQGCQINSCRLCRASISYISGFYAFSLQKVIKCERCLSALMCSPSDPCEDETLIHCKNYVKADSGKGLKFPSGSLCRLLLHCERILRKKSGFMLEDKQIMEKLLMAILEELNQSDVFPSLLPHQFDTADGTENHYLSLVHLVSKKYLVLRVRKILKDASLSKKFGNHIHRQRIFQNV